MKKTIFFTITVLLLSMICSINLSAISVDEIINRVDANQLYKTQAFAGTMVIQKGSRRLTKSFMGYGRKKGELSYIKFTNAEDRNVKYLRIDDELWIYFPKADDIMKISGHMLKQGMMGSDISYEDMLETEKFSDKYNFNLEKSDMFEGKNVYVVTMTAKVSDAKYAKEILYVDQKTFIPLKIDMYARGGRLIKTLSQKNIKKSGRRYVPYEVIMRDVRKKNSRTVIRFSKMAFDLNIPDQVFSKQYLRK